MKIKIMKGCSFLKKRLLINIMRIFLIFFCTTVFGLTPNEILSQNAMVSIDADKVMTVDEIFNLIMNQTDYNFVYQADMFKNSPKVPLEKGSIKVNTLLNKALNNGNYKVGVNKNNIVITKTNAKNVQEQLVLTGVITDSNGVPLPGITVYVTDKEPKSINSSVDFFIRGTATDFDGNFTIKAEEGNYIVTSGIGYDFYSQKVSKDQTNLKIVLEEKASELDEVVLVGYGTQTRGEISSAISTVQRKDIAKNVVGQTSFDRSLSGLVKGVNVKSTSGAPGAGIDINIRGYTSPFSGSDNNPLYVIDGVPFQANPTTIRGDETTFTEIQNPLLSINPDDIESFDVLKDAAATAIYGSRGANGVIIVKTKKGKVGEKMNVTYATDITLSKPIKTYDYLNAAENKEYLDTYFANTFDAVERGVVPLSGLFSFSDMINFNPDFTYGGLNDSYFGTADTDWNDEVYRSTAITKTHNLTIRGGGQKTAYSISGGYTDQEGIVKNDNFDQYNLRLSIDTKINKIFSTGTNINLSHSKRVTGQGYGGFEDSGLNARPDVPVFDEDGNPTRIEGAYFGFPSTSASPYANYTLQENITKAFNVLGNVYFKADITNNFSVKADINGSYLTTSNYTFRPNTIVGLEVPAFGITNESSASFAYDSDATNTNITTDLTANYNNKFGKHSIGGLLGYSWLRISNDRTFLFLQDFPDDFILTNASNANTSTASSSIIESGLNSFFGRASYNYDSKYFLNVTLRSDKSSKFAPGKKEAFFPSLAASWNVTRENFLKESKILNNLILRASIGKTGSTNLGDFTFLQGFERGFRQAGLYAGNSSIGLGEDLANENASWEETEEVNFGVNFGFFNSRLRGSVDIYDRKTTGALVNTPIALESGLSNFTSNFIDLSNKGFEIELGGDIIKTNNFKWSAAVNVSKNKNTIDKLTSTLGSDVLSPYEVGREINLIRGYVVEGIYQTDEEVTALNTSAPNGVYSTIGTVGAGDYKYKDINNDGQITVEDSYGIIGSSQPDYFGGFNTSIAYKSFELSAYFNFSQGGESGIFDGASTINQDPRLNTVARNIGDNRWSPTNTDATLPQLVYRGSGDVNTLRSTANLFDTSYVRLKNIQLAYNFSSEITEAIGVSNALIFIGGANLVTWTNFPGLDPENGFGEASSIQYSGRSYPNAKSWSLGIKVNF
ncbi:SusC/RagA family TonB-linked outer membrane protein [Cellulophaga geojensis]|nr:TonB-dependent receptor [Cellulophaga geojensis]